MNDDITPERVAAQMAFQSQELQPSEIEQAKAALDHLDEHQALLNASLELWSRRLRYSLEQYIEAGDKHPIKHAEGVRSAMVRYSQIIKSVGVES